jgi:hypothetical protein
MAHEAAAMADICPRPPLALQLGRGRSRYIDRDHASACLITANFACRATVFRELGGFALDTVAMKTASSTSGCGVPASAACMSIR